MTSSATSGPSTAAEVRPVERQIEARIADDGMGSMVRCILFVRTYITNHSPHPTPTLWAGTNSGAICVFNLGIPSGTSSLSVCLFNNMNQDYWYTKQRGSINE